MIMPQPGSPSSRRALARISNADARGVVDGQLHRAQGLERMRYTAVAFCPIVLGEPAAAELLHVHSRRGGEQTHQEL